MAIRVRKLARQLGRSPEDLIELLSSIGLSRYSKPDDMLPGPAAEALRAAMHKLPAPSHRTSAPPVRPPSTKRQNTPDMMASLVPGVVALDGTAAPSSAPAVPASPAVTPPSPAIVAPAGPSLDVQREELEALRGRLALERVSLDRLRAELDEQAQQLRARRDGLDTEQAELASEQAAVRHERAAVQQARARVVSTREDDETFLAFLLHRRGLRGMDECERALAALAQRRQLRPIIDLLRCDRPDRVSDVLEQRLVLVGGAVPDSLPDTLAAVAVAPERADVPGQRDLARGLARFGEVLLLHGLRRLTIVGGRPAWHKSLREGLDPRIALRFWALFPTDASTEPLGFGDLCVLWGVAGPLPTRLGGRGVVVTVDGDHLLSLLTGVEEFLRHSAA